MCFETLRYRNNLGQFRNDVNHAFDSAGLPERLAGDAFLNYCKSLFAMQADLRGARVGLVETYAAAIQTVVKGVADDESRLPAKDAATLILALSEAVPTEPGVAFLKRTLEIEGLERSETVGNDMENDSQRQGKTGRAARSVKLRTDLDGKTVDIVVPTTMTTAATVGIPELVFSCDPGKKPNPEGTECVDRCGHDGVQYDDKLNECVLKAVTQP